MNAACDEEIRFKLLMLLKDEPQLTQREMNRRMGFSLGKVNYCVTSLTRKGMIRVERSKNSPKKKAYLYQITPEGINEYQRLAFSYLKCKLEELDQIRDEIKRVSIQIGHMDSDLCIDPDLMLRIRQVV